VGDNTIVAGFGPLKLNSEAVDSRQRAYPDSRFMQKIIKSASTVAPAF